MFAALLVGLVIAQGASEETRASSDLDRIRKALAVAPAITVPASSGKREGPVFRVTVFGKKGEEPLWKDRSVVPPYIRPPMPIAHYEFLNQVTPDEFRAATVFPVGVPMVTLAQAIGKRIRIESRKAQEKRTREEVRKALDELLACRANPTRPGC
jgi:hypothetical protein